MKKRHWEQFQNPIEINVEGGNTGTPNTQIHDWSHSWIGTNTSITVAELNRFYGPKLPQSQMMRSDKCFPHVNKLPTITYNQCYSKERSNPEYYT